MDDDTSSIKRITDCVYFLASPLTCKKGADCEYRHNDIARLNPRECWYWLAKNCLNPACAFRHPPLDGLKEGSSIQLSQSADTKAPCYFYFSGCCNRGNNCSFSHSIDCYSNSSTRKLLNFPSGIRTAPALEDKTSIGTDANKVEKEVSRSSQGVSKNYVGINQTVPRIQSPAFDDDDNNSDADRARSVSPEAITSSEENVKVQPGSSSPSEGRCFEGYPLSRDQSSEELDSKQVSLEHDENETLELSSPLYALSSDDILKSLSYEEYPKDAMAIEMLDRDHKSNASIYKSLGHTDEELYGEYYPNFDLANEVENSYGPLYDQSNLQFVAVPPERTNIVVTSHIFRRKRMPLPTRKNLRSSSAIDLRDRIWERRRTTQYQLSPLSRKRKELCTSYRFKDKSYNPVIGHIHAKPATAARNYCLQSSCWNRRKCSRVTHGESIKNSFVNWPTHQYGAREHITHKPVTVHISRKENERFHATTSRSSSFTGPKTLTQLQNEKIAKQNMHPSWSHKSYTSNSKAAQFEGPKPLSEILKEKKKVNFCAE